MIRRNKRDVWSPIRAYEALDAPSWRKQAAEFAGLLLNTPQRWQRCAAMCTLGASGRIPSNALPVGRGVNKFLG